MKSVYARYLRKLVLFSLLATALIGGVGFSQGNMNVVLRGNWDNNALPTVTGYQYNDVWGYAAGGREYGMIGSTVGIHVIDITNPSAMVHVAQLGGGCASTIWRDFATYENYLYGISDNCAGGSLQIWDLSPLPSPPTLVYSSNSFFTNAHSILVNPESGRIYVTGANTQMNGVIILDVLGHPAAPTLAASFFLGSYTHDIYVHHDTLYGFFGANGVASFDLTNLSNPYGMGSIFTYPESGYAHSGVGLKNNKTLVWINETQNTGLHVANVADPYNITFQASFRSALLAPTHTNSMAHNIVAVGDYIFVSYYQDGLQIWNMNTPTSPVRVGYYDTNVNASYTGMFGAWGIHPPLPSGNILISDTQNGLFVLQFNNIFPAVMVHFAADALQDRVRLRWTTESETSCKSFMVERSANGEQFEDLHELPAAGNSTTRRDYVDYDDAPLGGKSYYRLRQIDFDGNVSYTEVQTVDMGTGAFQLTAFPNPSAAGDAVQVRIEALESATGELEVVDMMGRRIHHQSLDMVPGVFTVDLPTANWASGSYLMRLVAKGTQLEQKLLIAN